MYLGLAIGIAIFVIIIVVILLILIAVRPWIKNNVPIGGSCNDVNRCRQGLICDSGACKVPIGGACRQISDCVTPAIACFEGKCIAEPVAPIEPVVPVQPIIPIGPTAPTEPAAPAPTAPTPTAPAPTAPAPIAPTAPTAPTAPIETVGPIGLTGSFIPCGINDSCPPGYACQGSIVIRNRKKEYQFTNQKILDVTGFMNTILILLDDGNIVRDNGRSLSTIMNSVNLERIFVAGGILYGISNGYLYWMATERPSRERWQWRKLNWSPPNITHASASLNGEWLWLQSSSRHKEGTRGCLYKTPQMTTSQMVPPRMVEDVILKGDEFRVYGIDNRSYLEINPSQRKGTSFIDGQVRVIPGMVDGALMSDDTVIMVDRVQTIRLFSVRVIPQPAPAMSSGGQILTIDSVYEIENKLCERLLF